MSDLTGMLTKWLQVNYRLGADYYNIYYNNYYAIGSKEFANGAVYLYQFESNGH